MKHGILWDNDGVLVDTEGLFYEANRSLFAEHGIELNPDHFFDWFLKDNIGAWHLLEARGASPVEIHQLRIERNRRYSLSLQSGENLAIPGVKQALIQLQTKARMGIVTSSRLDHFHMIHQQLDLLPHFEFAVTEEDYANSKPAPDPYLLGLKKFSLPTENCLAIEDSPRGLQAANAAGLRCIVIRSELSRHFAFDGAYCVVEGVGELLGVVEDVIKSGSD